LLVIDAEDTFTAMLGIQLADLGADVTIRRFDEPLDQSIFELVLLGPGPGDPRDRGHKKIDVLRRTGLEALTSGQPLLAVCLGHQVLCGILGLAISRRTTPNQGRQYEIDLFDRRRRVGFYNTFSAVSEVDQFTSHLAGGTVTVSRDRVTREVHGLRGPRMSSLQFHPESVLSPDGVDILTESLLELLPPQAVRLPA
jgi:phenazine biosynthesis protein phzE